MTIAEKAEFIIRDIKCESGVKLEIEEIKCEYSHLNEQCIKERCPYYD